MPRNYERVTSKLFEKADHLSEVFDRVFYQEVRWWRNHFSRCIWRECKFYHTSFARNSVFSGCIFERCRFWGQHTYLGGPARFDDCEFRDCRFEKVQFWETHFVRCKFSGTFHDVVFYGPEAPKGWSTEFEQVDLSGVTMEYTDFRSGIDLSTTKMPAGLRR